jgi:hypothetical protein
MMLVGDRPLPPHEKGPAPKKIIFFILKNPAKKRFSINYYGPLAADTRAVTICWYYPMCIPIFAV